MLLLMLFIIQNTWANELELLKKLVSATANLKTWDTIDINQVGINDLSFDSETSTNLENQDTMYNDLYKKLNHKMFHLQCTYAFYASKHLYTIHTHIIDKFLTFEVLMPYLTKLKSLYLDAALQTITTMTNISYMQPPDWMLQFIEYLKIEEVDEKMFHPNMGKILKTLKEVTSQPNCNPRNLPSLLPKFSSDGLQPTDDENATWEEFIPQIKEIEINTDLRKFIVQNNLTNYILEENKYDTGSKNKVNNDLSKPENAKFKKEINNIKAHDSYIFSQFKKAEIDIRKNLIEINYLLYLNKPILSYDNYKTINILEYEKTANIEIINHSIDKIQYTTTGYDDVDKKIQEAEELHNKFLLLSKIRVWDQKQIESDEREIIEYKPSVNELECYDKKIDLLISINTAIIDKLQCTYMLYTEKHLLIIDGILEKTESTLSNKHMELINAYFDVSLKMLASIFNIEEKKSFSWNIETLIYFRKISNLKIDLNTFMTENSKILESLKDDCGKCHSFYGSPPTFEVSRQTIQNPEKYSKEHSYLQTLQLELSVLNVSQSSDEIDLSNLYRNLIEVLNFLNLNENYLNYY